ncbi:MAG TPA: S-layer homology domain-containing protein [Ruminiclostridium sp.]|nr:S-layer homology domain-containing protein [Ruminiclostridium sp.]
MHKKFSHRLLRAVTAVLITGNTLLGFTSVQAATVGDPGKSSAYAREAVQWMSSNNITSGDKHGNFNPEKGISRAELVTLLVKAFGIDTSNLPEKAAFSDVPASHWAFKYIEAANRAGIVSGMGNGSFGVNNQSTREQIAAMLLNYLSVSKEAVVSEQGLDELAKFKDEGKMSDWAKPSIKFAVSNNIMSGMSADSFSPAGQATKEQVAVILYKFLNSKQNIEQNASALKKIIVTYNNDIIRLDSAPKIVNDEVMLPTELFSKIGVQVVTDSRTNGIVIKSTTAEGRNIYMSIDNKTAFVNYTGNADPFSNPSALNQSAVLNNAPEKEGETVFVPARAVADALGITMDWNPKLNLLKIKDSSVVKNPQLYNAMKGLLQYNGEYTSDTDMNMKKIKSGMDFGISIFMNGAVNGNNSTSNSKLAMALDGEPEQAMEYETINIGDKIYSRNKETGTWNTYTRSQADENGIIYYDLAADRNQMLRLLDIYGKMNISAEGKTTLDSKEVSKYQIKLSMDMLQGLASADMLEYGTGMGGINKKGLDCSMEMYVNTQGQLIKQSVIISGSAEIKGSSTNVNLTANTAYSNIGKGIGIVSPVQ